MRRPTVSGAALLMACTLSASSATAQAAGRGHLSVLVGPSPYDLAGTGTGTAANLGLTWRPLRRVLLLEPSLGAFTYRPDFAGAERQMFVLPELSVQAEARLGPVRPYLGGGGGGAWRFAGGQSRWEPTLHALAGLRLDVGPAWGARAELRVRSINPWGASTADIGFGISRRVF